MGNHKSKISSDTGNKDTVADRQTSVRMVKNLLLIWLDNTIDEENSIGHRNTISQLRRIVNTIKTYTNGEQCIKFLKSTNNERVCMIISGSLGQHIVPRVHDMVQVDSIFIFCNNRKHDEQWAKDWSKIKGVFTAIEPICETLQKASQECQHNTISMSFLTTSDDVPKKNLDQLDCSFMYTQILKEILLSIKFEQQHFKEFISFCREQFVENRTEIANVNKIERKYRDETPIWWYTYECFLYSMVNRAIRLMDVDIIVKMGFFINDLHRHIEQLHSEQFSGHHLNKTFTVYRGQGISNGDFEQLTKTKGGLMCFNNFLSVSKNRDTSLEFASQARINPDLVGVLFVMKIDPSKSTTPFASTANVTYYQNTNDEILFSMHTIFRICEIKPIDESHRLFQVDLTLTKDDDKQLRVLTDCIREETCPDSKGWYRLGLLLFKMGRFHQAQQVYEGLLEQTVNGSEKASIYSQLGVVKHVQGKYNEAMTFYEKSLQIYKKTSRFNNPDVASSYNNIGKVYRSMGEYSKAISSHKKSLAIWQKILPADHPDLAACYNNIGEVYRSMCEYSKAFLLHEKSLAIWQKILPANHPDLAACYNNIGQVYYNMREYSKALSLYRKSLEIKKEILPCNHSSLAASYNNIGLVYENEDDHSEALSLYERAVHIGQLSLPSDHPELQQWRKNFENVKKKL